jgi:PAS domain S-box-containing protein
MLPAFEKRVQFDFVMNESLDSLKRKVEAFKPGTLVLLMPFARDSEGVVISFTGIAKLVSAASPVPVYGTWDFYFGHGIVGGRLTDGYSQGSAAAMKALRVLKGETPESIPIQRSSPTRFMFDTRQLKRFKISESDLPEGSYLGYQTWYEINRYYVWASILSGVLMLALICLLVLVQFKRRRAEKEGRAERERTALQLETSHNLINKLSRQVPGAIFQFQLFKDGRSCFPYASDGIQNIYEVTPEQVREDASPVFAVLHPDDYNRVTESIRESARTSQTWQLEYRVKLPSKGVRWLSGLSKPELLEDGSTIWHGFITDITESKQMEAKFRALFDQSSFLAGILDQQGRLVDINSTALNLIGAQRKEVIGKYFPDTPWWSDAQDRVKLIEVLDLAYAGTHASFEAIHRIPTGGHINVLFSAMPIFLDDSIQMAVIGVDITQRINAEEMQRENETRFRFMLENSPIAVRVTNLTTGQIVFANQRYAELIDSAPVELMKIDPKQYYVNPQDYADVIGQLNKGEVVVNKLIELKIHGEYSESKWTLASYLLLKFQKEPSILGWFYDITERKHAEVELLRSNDELEQFSYAVSHDMRQPLRMISSYLQLLEMSLVGQLDDEKREYFNFAIEGAKRIDQMLMALLEYSRVGRQGEPQTLIESHAVLDEALLFLQPAIAEAQAKLTINGDWPRIMGSHDEILRLLQNLIGNAVKYRIAGRIPEITVSSEMVRNEWHLSVADNGVGILPSQVERLFKVFQRLHTRATYEGTGIGLALCRKIVEHHNGRIWAESAGEGLGSKFCVVLPCGGR